MVKTATHLAFQLSRRDIVDGILIPKFYDPDLKAAEKLAAAEFDLIELGQLLLPGSAGSRLGNWIRREHYGSGDVPFVRTSDLVNWRIRPDFKKAVSESVYHSVAKTQDIAAGDILFVAHGTYLVGQVALVTKADEKIVLQDHVFRLRVDPQHNVSPELLIAALSTSFVKRQVRSRQFSADIIDKIGERHLSIKVPLPRSPAARLRVENTVRQVLADQDLAKKAIAEGTTLQSRMTKERAHANLGFQVTRNNLRSRILIPKYYDPRIEAQLNLLQKGANEKWLPISHYIECGLLAADTGVEVGKMAYGLGAIPFLRTSDIVDLEIRRDPRHCVDQAVFDQYSGKAGVLPGDVLVVRDGTYLVGSSAIVGKDDGPALICGGIYRLRVTDSTKLPPESLLLALNLPVVRQQLRAFQFTRDVIDTLGKRLLEVLIPPLKDKKWVELGLNLRKAMDRKAQAKVGIGQAIAYSDPPIPKVEQGRPSWSMR